MRSRPRIEVATWSDLLGGRDLILRSRPGSARRGVATRNWRRNLARLRQAWRVEIWRRRGGSGHWGRDLVLRSRPGLFWLGGKEVATWD